ncbi:MAG TPA: DUF192 domain-containing protein [Patescibacteria group bacterium]|nr:DUF192 domain-containing protein [Patescibacteria group bacterium]
MRKFIIGFIVVLIVIIGGIFLAGSKSSLFGKKATATFGSTKITLDVADTEQKRETGLSGKTGLSDNQGMLFLFDEPGIPSFWMKGMKFPLDIIFLNNNKIVTIYKNVPAPKTTTEIPTTYYQPTAPANKVLELKAGSADKYNLHNGDAVQVSL